MKRLVSLLLCLCILGVPFPVNAATTQHEYLSGEEFDKSAFSSSATIEGFSSTVAGNGLAKVTDNGVVTEVPYSVTEFKINFAPNYALDEDLVLNFKGRNPDGSEIKFEIGNNILLSGNTSTSSVGDFELIVGFKGRQFKLPYSVRDRVLRNIKPVAGSFQLRYMTGDYFNGDGAQLELSYDDGSRVNRPVTSDMISNFDTTTPGNKNMTVTYRGQSCTVPYIVEAAPIEVAINYSRFDTEYKVGDALKSDLYLTVMYADFSNKEVKVDKSMVSGFDTSKAGSYTMTVNYLGFVARAEYTVENTVVNISVDSGSIPTSVQKGSNLDLTNARLSVNYKDGTKDTLPITIDMVTGFDSATEGQRTLYIRYKEFSTNYAYEVVDSYKPTLDAYIDDDKYTSGDVDIKVRAGGSYDKIRLPDGDTTTRSSYTYTVEENGSYEFILKSSRGDIQKTVQVDCIDKDAPELRITLAAGKATMNVSDKGSGIKKVTIQDGTTYTSNQTQSRNIPLKTGTITAVDKAGNEVSYAMTVSNGITFLYNKTDTTEIQVMASNIKSITLGGQSRSFVGENNVQSFTNTAERSNVFTIEKEDGSQYNVTINVNGKDNQGPSIFFTQSNDKVTWRVEDDSAITLVKVNDVSTSMRSNTVTLEKGKSITVYAKDSYGNSSTKTYTYGDSGEFAFRIELQNSSGYIQGYPDKSFKPDNNVTRAEVATMVARLLKGDSSYYPSIAYTNDQSQWWWQSAAKCSQLGAFAGIFTESDFQPDKPATRLEVATILYNVVNTTGQSTKSKFTDTSNAVIVAVSNAGLINGYPDGTFKPYGQITRAELVTMLNAMLGDKLDSDDPASTPQDIKGHWAEDAIKLAM